MKMKTNLMLFFAVFLSTLLSSCIFDKAEVRFSLQKEHDVEKFPRVQIKVHDGAWVYDVVLDNSRQTFGPLKTRRSGTLTIEYVVLHNGDRTDTSGHLVLPLKSDWRWGVDFWIRENNPFDTCFGCSGWDSKELDPILEYDEVKKLWVVYGGNSINNPAVY